MKNLKKLLLFMTGILFLPMSMEASEPEGYNSPFAEEGKRWNYRYVCSHPDYQYLNYDYSYFIHGDTIINGIICKKLYYEQSNETSYKGAIYEEEKCVIFFPQGKNKSYILFDFGREVGEMMITGDEKVSIIEIDSIKVSGIVFRRFLSEHGAIWPYIEGIGTLADMFMSALAPDNFYHFISCEKDGSIIFTASDFYAPSISGKTFFPEGTSWTLGCYDAIHAKSYDVCTYEVVGDTIISGQTYRNVWAKATGSEENAMQEPYSLREESGRVYVYYHEHQREVMYYDFNWDEAGKAIALNSLSNDRYDVLGTVTTEQLADGSLGERSGDIIRTIGRVARSYGGLFAPEVVEFDNGTTYSITSFVRDGVELYHQDLKQPDIHDCDLTVWVKDTKGQPITGATISLIAFDDSVFAVGTTNAQGKFSDMILSPGAFQSIQAEAKGYQVCELPWTAATEVTINFVLEKASPATIIHHTATQAPVLFDLQGRRLNAVPTRGLYVKDGRKYVK